MRPRTYVVKKATAKSRWPAGKGDAGKTEIHSDITSCVCQDRSYLAKVPETSTCETPDPQRCRLHSKQCLLSTSEKQAASLHVLKREYIVWKAWRQFSMCSGMLRMFQAHSGLWKCLQMDLPSGGESCANAPLHIHRTLRPPPSVSTDERMKLGAKHNSLKL